MTTITIPDWFLYMLAVLAVLYIIETVLGIVVYIQSKILLRKIKNDTTDHEDS